jgi:hypothetical protein
MVNYDFKPAIYSSNGDGSYTYRWNIKAIETVSGHEGEEVARTSWQCDEVIVWATVTKSKLTAAVLSYLWPADYESKLMNDHNAAKLGRLDSSYIAKYEDFIKQRKAVKRVVEADYRTIFNVAYTLQDAIADKLADLEDYDTSDEVNSFLVNGLPVWINSETRSVYSSSIEAAKKCNETKIELPLGGMFLDLSLDQASGMLAQIQRYADKAAITTAKHKYAISTLETIEEVTLYDYTIGYPEKVELPLIPNRNEEIQ